MASNSGKGMYDFTVSIPADITKELNNIIGNLKSAGGSGGGSGSGSGKGSGGPDIEAINKALRDLDELINKLSQVSEGMKSNGKADFVQGIIDMANSLKDVSGKKIEFEFDINTNPAIENLAKLREEFGKFTEVASSAQSGGEGKEKKKYKVKNTNVKAKDNWTSVNNAQLKSYNKIIGSTSGKVKTLDRLAAFNGKYDGVNLADSEIDKMVQRDMTFLNAKIAEWWNTSTSTIESSINRVAQSDNKRDMSAYVNRFQDLKNRFDQFTNNAASGKKYDTDTYAQIQADMSILLKELSSTVKRSENVSSGKEIENLNKLLISISKYRDSNTKMNKSSLKSELDKLEADINKYLSSNGWETSDDPKSDIANFRAQFSEIQKQATQTGMVGQSVANAIRDSFLSGAARMFGAFNAYNIINKFREMYNIVLEIDSSMTNLKRITSETATTYNNFLDGAAVRAQKLGTTIKEVVDATTNFVRLGYDLNEASGLADVAIMYRNVGEVDVDTATGDLTSVLKAYDLAAKDAEHIVDVFNILGDRFATTSAAVGAGLNRSASALRTANNSFEESAAMITAITEITQDSQSAGNALKTLSLRLRSTKTELAEMGEDAEGAATTTSKLRNTLKGLTGVDIMLNSTEYKSTYQIMSEIANVWYRLTDAEKAATIELLAGKTRANQVAALLNNWSQAEKALTTSLNSNGIAAKENEQYLDSMMGRTQQLKSSFEALSTNFIESENAKIVLELLNDIMKTLGEIGDGNVVLPLIVGVGGLINSLKTANRESLTLADGVRNIFDIFKGKKDVSLIQQSLAGRTGEKLAEGQLANAKAAVSSSIAFNALSAAIAVAVSAYAAYEQKQKEIRENAIATASAINEEAQEYDANIEAIQKLRNELSDSSLSQEEYNHVKEQLIEIQDKIIDQYGQEAQSIDLVNGKIDEQISKYRELKTLNISKTVNENTKVRNKAEEYLTAAGMATGGYFYNGQYYSTDQKIIRLGKAKNLDTRELEKINEIVKSKGFRYIQADNFGYNLDSSSFSSLVEAYDALEELKIALTNEYGTSNEGVSELISEINSSMNMNYWDISKPFQNIRGMTINDFGDTKYKQYVEFIEEDVKNRIELDDELSSLDDELKSQIASYNSAIDNGNNTEANKILENIEALRTQIDERIASVFAGDNNVVSRYEADKYFSSQIDTIISSQDKALEDFTRNVVENTDFGKYIKENKSASKTKNFVENIVGNEEINQFKTDLQEAGYSLDKFINALLRLGYIDEYNPITVTTQAFSTIAEDAEKSTKAVDSFSSAIAKVSGNNALSYDDINSLLAVDPSLVNSIASYKDGYTIALDDITKARSNYVAKMRTSYEEEIADNARQIELVRKNTEDAKRQLEEGDLTQAGYNKAVEENNKKIEELEGETAYYQFLITNLLKPTETYGEVLSQTSNNMKTQGEIIGKANAEMKQYGKISNETATSIMSTFDNWRDIIEYDSDSGGFVAKNIDDFGELIKQSSGYNAQLEILTSRVDELNKLKTQTESRLKYDRSLSGSDADSLRSQLELIDVQLQNAETDANAFADALKILMGLATGNQALSGLKTQIEEIDHQLAMGLITETEYYNKYSAAVSEAKKGYEGEDKDFWSFDETLYAKRVTAENKAYEDALKQLRALHEDGLIEDEDYISRKKALDAKYYGKGSFLGGTTEGQDKYFELQREQIQEEIKVSEDAYSKQKKALDNALNDRLISYEDYMKSMSDLNEKYYGKDTLLGSRKEGKEKYQDNLREIQRTNKDAFDYSIKQLDDALELGKISVAQYWQMYGDYAEKYLKDIPQLADDYQSATKAIMTTGIKAQYEDDRKHLDRLFEQNKISLSAYLDECEKMWQKYYANKKELEDEDYAAMQEIQQTYKSGISTQIDALNNYAKQMTKPLQNQIDVLNDIKSKQDDIYDAQIKKLQLQKDVIEERNKKEKQENEILKARNELLKAEMKTRLVYDGQGGFSLRRDEEKYQEALKGYRDAERSEQIQKLDDQIDAINRLKSTFDNEIAVDIKALQLEMQIQQEPINEMVKILEEMLELESAQYDPEFVKRLLGSDAGRQATKNAEERNALRRELFNKYGSDDIYKDLFNAYKGTGNLNALDPRYYMSGSDYKAWQKLQSGYGIYTLSGSADDYIKKYGMTANDADIYRKLQKKYAVKNPYSTTFSVDELEKTASELAKKYNMTTEDYLKFIGFDLNKDKSSADKLISKIKSFTNEDGSPNLVKAISQGKKPLTTAPESSDGLQPVPMIDNPVFNIYVGENTDAGMIANMRSEASKMFVEFTDMVTSKISSSFASGGSKTKTE